ncbi:MAG: glycerophosphoryl diester phosphodiesterase [Nocardioidaceae bacterium]|nr:glycerophosphoryl diester phosphodiesterase [Nocardioidaceae bacterium]
MSDFAPLVIGHRGAPGYRPEHTLASYRLAIEMGADYIEPDLVSTRDGVLVARHENEIGATTDVASRPRFADRGTTRIVEGRRVSGWFTEDFTLAELKTLRARERLPAVRPRNTWYDGHFEVPTFDEVLELASRGSERRCAPVGVYPETKHPEHFADLGLSLEEPLLAALRRHDLDRPGAPVLIQSFRSANLRTLASMTELPLVQLVPGPAGPCRDLLTPSRLREVATYAAGVGVPCGAVRADGRGRLTDLAHAGGLVVHAWTARDENRFLPQRYRRGADPDGRGDGGAHTEALLEAGVDGVFTDQPDTAVQARGRWLGRRDSRLVPAAALG